MNEEYLNSRRLYFRDNWDQIPPHERGPAYRRFKLECRAFREVVGYDPHKHGSYDMYLRTEDREVELIQQEWEVTAAGPQNGKSIFYKEP